MKVFWKVLVGLLALRLALMAVVPVFEPSEARYAAISANMARSGDFVVPRFTHNCEYQSFDGKPPLVFQAGGLFCKVLGVGRAGQDNPYALQLGVRIFPLLSAVLLLAILYHAVKFTGDGEAAQLAVVICATCTAFYAAAGMSMTDMTLTCCVAGALLLYACVVKESKYDDESKYEVEVEARVDSPSTSTPPSTSASPSTSTSNFDFLHFAGVAALLGAGMIVKGPVALVLFGLPVFVDALVNRHWKYVFSWKWLLVAPVFFAIAVPWFVLIEQRNPGAVWYFFYNENFMRFLSHDYGDKYGAGREAFRGVSVLWAFVATLPWALVPVWEGLRGLRSLRGLRGCGEETEQSDDRTIKQSNNQAIKQSSNQAIKQSNNQTIKQFEILSVLAIVGFWCLTSRVLLYYLFPMIPLFAAVLAKTGDRVLLKRLVPWCAGVSALVVAVALVGGMFFSDKMLGAKTPFDVRENHYANEFYHGTKPADELAKRRTERAKWLEAVEAYRVQQKAVRKANEK